MSRIRKEISYLLETGLPVVVQLMGVDPDLIAEVASRYLCIEGVVGINFNFACPSKRVVMRGAGGSCMQNPALMKKIIERCKSRCGDKSVSAKIRTGFSRPDECLEILPMLRDVGCDFVAVHHRTVTEGYAACPDRLRRLEKAKQAWGEKTFLASGDIFGIQDILELEQSSCCDGVMIARGLIRKPLLLAEARDVLSDETRQHTGDLHQREQAFEFLEHVLILCSSNVKLYWNHRYLMELTRGLFGVQDPVFRALTQFKNHDGPMALLEKLVEFKQAELV